MQTWLKTKIGPFLVISSVLALWTFLAAQPVQAHTLTNPSCGGLPTADNFYTNAATAPLSNGTATGSPTPKQGTGASGGGSRTYHYAKITVPTLTAGKLTVSGGTNVPSEAALCRGSSAIASSLPSYRSAHNTANAAADTAAAAQTTAQGNNTSSGESTARGALRTAANALDAAARALDSLATALTNAGEDPATVTAAAGQARTDATAARDAATAATTPTDSDTTDEAAALGAAATDLDEAATALDTEMVFASIEAIISSGTTEYVVVVTIPADSTIAALSVSFEGVMSTVPNAADGGEFTLDNQLITRTLATTSGTSGLLTVRTTGNAADTKGTLDTDTTPGNGATDIAMDGGSGGNFEIVSPVGTGTYQIHVEGQTPGERGEFGLEVEFGVASALTLGTPPTGTALKPGRADYFFFTVSAGDYSFLTVGTETPASVTKETDTTGAFFSQKGLVATDTNSGPGNNFLLRAPISPGNYIVEVKGASSSTEGAYNLVTSTQTVATGNQHGMAPDSITGSATVTEIPARGVVPHSITVDTPGTLQVKTTGDTDTVGVLYGPDGQQITTDDNSGKDMNFLITQYVGVGQHIVTVGGRTASDISGYTLVVNFVAGATIDGPTTPTTPGTGTETEQELRDQIADLQDDLTMCTPHVETDATGNLDDPNSVAPNNGYRSGVGLIRGWVCAANEVEVRIYDTTDTLVATVSTPHGSVRPDTAARCGGDSNTGFAAQYNYNHLAEGVYTAQVYADDQRVGEERTFEVVHLTEFSRTDTDRFLRDLPAGTCDVEDFPETGEATRLRWEESLQNFVIEDAG